MKRRTDEEIQQFLDGGGSADEARGWDPDELIDLRVYTMLDEMLAEEPEFALPPDFADALTDRLMPRVVAPSEGIFLGVLLAVFAAVGGTMVLGTLPAVSAAVGEAIVGTADGGPEVLAAAAIVLVGLLFLDRLLSRSRESPPRPYA